MSNMHDCPSIPVRAEPVEAPLFLRAKKKNGPSTSSGQTGKSRAWVIALPIVLTACAQQVASGVAPAAPGFLLGLWHGFIFPVAWVLSLFVPDIAVYAVPNNGGWYDFGYFLGIVVFGVGARQSKTVYVTRRSR